MIKILAAFFMLLDHVGAILLPDVFILRLFGRLSMPLFAFSVARGYHSAYKDRLNAYVKKLTLFSLISQVPFSYFRPGFLNIGFTWLLSVALLAVLSMDKRNPWFFLFVSFICVSAVVLPFDYGLYGVLYSAVLYTFLFKRYKPDYAFIGSAVLFGVAILQDHSAYLQFVAFLSVPLMV